MLFAVFFAAEPIGLDEGRILLFLRDVANGSRLHALGGGHSLLIRQAKVNKGFHLFAGGRRWQRLRCAGKGHEKAQAKQQYANTPELHMFTSFCLFGFMCTYKKRTDGKDYCI